MKNIELIQLLLKYEDALLAHIDSSTFFRDVDMESDSDIINDFLSKYILLKIACKKQISVLSTRLVGKQIVVSGGSSGIGQQVVNVLLKLGAKVIVFDIKDPENDNVEWYKVDVTSEQQVYNAAKQIDVIDYLVTCAGLFGFDDQMTTEQKDREFDVNLNGTKNCVNAFLEKLKQSNGGVCGVLSGLCVTLDPTCLTYCISKQEIRKFLNSKKNEGIKVNSVLPGPILTPLLLNDVPTLKELAEYSALNPEAYCGCPEHIALGVASIIINNQNGIELALDGGESKMFRKNDNKYWIEDYSGGFSIEFRGTTYTWDLDKSYCNGNIVKNNL